MAENYVLSCCSTADLTDEQFEARSIHYICFHFELGGKSYMDDLGKSIPFDEFYKRMEQGEDTKTSQINAEEFEQYFEPFLQEGKDILHVCLSFRHFRRHEFRLYCQRYSRRKISRPQNLYC